MFLPKTEIRYSWPYNKEFYPELSNEEFYRKIWLEVIKIGKKFERLYNKYIQNILELIPKFSGFSWREFADPFIPIYLVKKSGTSISDPLTLKIRKDTKLMLVILTHELSHRNLPPIFSAKVREMLKTLPKQEMKKERERRLYLRETAADLITIHVFKEIGNFKNKITTFLQFNKKRFGKTTLFDLDLNKTTIKEWFSEKELL